MRLFFSFPVELEDFPSFVDSGFCSQPLLHDSDLGALHLLPASRPRHLFPLPFCTHAQDFFLYSPISSLSRSYAALSGRFFPLLSGGEVVHDVSSFFPPLDSEILPFFLVSCVPFRTNFPFFLASSKTPSSLSPPDSLYCHLPVESAFPLRVHQGAFSFSLKEGGFFLSAQISLLPPISMSCPPIRPRRSFFSRNQRISLLSPSFPGLDLRIFHSCGRIPPFRVR